jgi:type I restriction enzyme R subunit
MEQGYTEFDLSQKPALDVLERMGYTILKPEDAEVMRGSKYAVILYDVLRTQISRINEWEYRGKRQKFSEKNIEQAILDIDEPLSDGLIKTNEKIYNMLLLGRSYPEEISAQDGSRSFNLNYIDWINPDNNVFHAVEEFSVEREDGQGNIRPDIVLFINGIPFGVIELKKPDVSISQAISQMIRNQAQNYAPHLFKFAQILMAAHKNEAQYATVGTPLKFWQVWKEETNSEEYEWYKNQLNNAVENRIPTIQDQNIVSIFHPERVLPLIKSFIIYDKNDKKIARYQQYFAVKEIINTIQQTDHDGNRQSGVIWHTQGSGKSLTMVMLTKYLMSELAHIHPQVVIITDRIELDSQIHKTFNQSRLKAARATSGKNLVDLIHNRNADIITSLVHKFDTASKKQTLVKSKDVFILVDESHRTQYGELHTKMRQVFPNACYLGFTGTPLMKDEKNTMIKFGRLIHKYTIKDGVNDKTIVPLLYEGRMVDQTVNRVALDNRLDMITRNLNDKQAELLRQKWSNFEKVASSEQRIRLIADDIYTHFTKFYKGTPLNAMLATDSKFDAIRYKEAFDEYGDIRTAVIISPPDMREGNDEVDGEVNDRVVKFWKKQINAYGDSVKYEEHIKNEFVYGDEIELIIVVDKLLTGFDAPRASVLYVDKPIKEHALLQAIARVNRIYEGKDYGLIVDYRGLLKPLNDALEMYSGAGLEKYDGEDIQGALVDVVSIAGKLREAHSHLLGIFKEVKNRKDREEFELLLADDKIREDFYNQLSLFGKYLAIALESVHLYNALGETEINTFKSDFKYYQELRATVKLRYSDAIDHKEYEAKMRNLMDTYIAAEQVIKITSPVDILDKTDFENELNKLGSNRSKADAIRTRMTQRIHFKYNENPAYYKKFSERIQEIIDEYKRNRISDADYFKHMQAIAEDFRRGYSGTTYPRKIKHDGHAQAFYGVLKDSLPKALFNSEIGNEDAFTELLADIAIAVNEIIEKNSKVDWHDNLDVHKKITAEIDDYLYNLRQTTAPGLTFDIIDRLISDIKTVALRRY